jgi:erythronate-4-phosphate dehydrogenase
MKIVADANIPYVEQAFGSIGEVTLVEGRSINQDAVKDADLLLVRSVTPVSERLLSGSAVKFVATATIGVDHVDTQYLQERGIGFASAPGCNAISAAEYVMAALFELAMRDGFTLQSKTVGIVGCGNVGSKVLEMLQALQVPCLIYDPPRADQYADRAYVDWEQVTHADVVTAHVPLHTSGNYPTYHMFAEKFFQRLPNQGIFINTARGRVVDEVALKAALQKRDDIRLVLDVWENEPNIDLELLNKIALATPHIAGYSLDGKVRGTKMIYHAVCEFFQLQPTWKKPALPFAGSFTATQFDADQDDVTIVREAIKNAYDICRDDRNLRAVFHQPEAQRGVYFDRLRKDYPVRREFSCFEAILPPHRQTVSAYLRGLGFKVEIAGPEVHKRSP